MVSMRPCEYCADVRCSKLEFLSCINTHTTSNITTHSSPCSWTCTILLLGLLCASYTSFNISLQSFLVFSLVRTCAVRAQMLCISSLLYCNWQLESILHRLHIHIPRKVQCLLMQKFLHRRSTVVTSFMTAVFNHDKCLYLFIHIFSY